MRLVSIIVPCYNEQRTIRWLLDALYAQTYPHQKLEVVIADGLSTDQTREEIVSFQKNCPDLKVVVVDNPKRSIPAGLNRAIVESKGDYIVRLDAHSIPHPDYVERCISVLLEEQVDNVGGKWEIRPGGEGWLAESIAIAAAHPLGVGDARYRIGGKAQEVDTVPFGAFRRELIEKIGGFDESLLSNEDYEFNARIRQYGGKVWFDPGIRAVYFARRNLFELAQQYWRYGYWKARMLLRYPRTFRWRQLAGFFVLSLIVFGVLGIWFLSARRVLFVEVGIYLLVLLFSGLEIAWQRRYIPFIIGIPLAIATMHFSWGVAFLWSLFKFFLEKNRKKPFQIKRLR